MLINPRLPARALFQGFFRAGGCWKSREGVHWASIPSRDPPAPAIFRARGILCLMSRTSHPTPGPAPPLRRAPRPRRRPSPRLRARYFGISTLAPPLPRTPSAHRPPKFPDGIPSGTGVRRNLIFPGNCGQNQSQNQVRNSERESVWMDCGQAR